MNQVLIATAIVVLIMAAGMYAVSTMLDAGIRSTESSLTDTDKRLEEVDPEFQFDGQILLTNAGGEEAEIVMMRFYDSDGAIAYRAIMDDGTGRNFTGYDTTLTPMSMPVGGQKSLGLAEDMPDLGEFERADVVTSYGNVFTVDLPVVGGYGSASWNATEGGWTVPGPDGTPIPVGPDGGVNGTGFGDGAVGVAIAGLSGAKIKYHDTASRDQHWVFSGHILYGSDDIGTIQPITPYVDGFENDNEDYIALVEIDNGDHLSDSDRFTIKPYHKYAVTGEQNGNRLVEAPRGITLQLDNAMHTHVADGAERSIIDGNFLAFSRDNFDWHTTNTIQKSVVGNTVTFSAGDGPSRLIYKMGDVSSRLVLEGDAADGTTFRVVESPYDLETLPIENGMFRILSVNDDPEVDNLETLAGSKVLSGSVEGSVKINEMRWTQTAAADVIPGGSNAHETRTASAEQTRSSFLYTEAHPDGYIEIVGDHNRVMSMNVTETFLNNAGDRFLTPPKKHTAQLTERCQGPARCSDVINDGRDGSVRYNRMTDITFTIYDTLPVKMDGPVMSGSFGVEFENLRDNYLVIDSTQAGESTIRAYDIQDRDFIHIGGLEDAKRHVIDTLGYPSDIDNGTAFSVTAEHDEIIAGGLSDDTITMESNPDTTSVKPMYVEMVFPPSALVYRGWTSDMIVFDRLNHEVLTAPGGTSDAYVPHVYVKVPITQQVEISNVRYERDISLPYLDGTYESGEFVMIPLIPTGQISYNTVYMTINGVEVPIRVTDLPGVTGLKIAEPASNTINISQDEFVDSIGTSVGMLVYAIAGEDGYMKAHVQAVVSGKSEITNTRTYAITPSPGATEALDPLTTWIDIYVNGYKEESRQIFFSDEPVMTSEAGQSGQNSVYHTVIFEYPEVRIFDTVSHRVNEGDFVEFHFYNKIEAEGSEPPLPSGFQEYSRHGKGSATASLIVGSINTSM